MADDTTAVSDEQVALLLHQYDADRKLYEGLADELKRMVERVLEAKGLRVHSVTARVKDRSELEKKIRRGHMRFTALCDVVDVVGLRIITHFPDEVDAIARVVAPEFEIDEDRSTDKRELLNPDQFGYLSRHYVARLPERRLHTELRRHADSVFELQVRSILQHAWAEIEHDLGYKSREAVPRHIRRRFSRLAGLLELADDEFKAIREELATYRRTVEQEVRDDPASVYIDQNSLLAYVRTDRRVYGIDTDIAHAVGGRIGGQEMSAESAAQQSRAAILVGFRTIADLDTWLERYAEFLVAFGAQITPARPAFSSGLSVACMADVRAAMSRPAAELRRYVREAIGGRHSDVVIADRATRILDAFEKAKEAVPFPDPPT